MNDKQLTPEEMAFQKYPVDMKTESLLGNIHTFDNNKWDREIYLEGLKDSQQTATLQARVAELEIENRKLEGAITINLKASERRQSRIAELEKLLKDINDLYNESEEDKTGLFSRINELERDKEQLHKVIVGHEETNIDLDTRLHESQQHAERLMGLLEEVFKKRLGKLMAEDKKENYWQSYCKENNLKSI